MAINLNIHFHVNQTDSECEMVYLTISGGTKTQTEKKKKKSSFMRCNQQAKPHNRIEIIIVNISRKAAETFEVLKVKKLTVCDYA